jgi:hypothetical protein
VRTATQEPLRPLGEMPIWARLALMKMIPETYAYYDSNGNNRLAREPWEATVQGFVRKGDTVWIYFKLDWDDDPQYNGQYVWPAIKSGSRQDCEYLRDS